MGMCGNEDFTLPKQILALEGTFADECRSSTTMQGFALVPIANRAGHGFVIDEGYRERWVCRLRCRASFRAGRLSRATANVYEGRVIDVEVFGRTINRWVKAPDGRLGSANVHRLARDVSPSPQRAKLKASK